MSEFVRLRFFVFASAFVALLALGVTVASAQGAADLSFPVSELGGCESREACEAFCNEPDHIVQCVEFAKRHNLVQYAENAEVAERVVEGGPGGCRSEEECYAYCEGPEHRRACVDFAEQNGFMTFTEATQARADLERGEKFGVESGPGGCTSEESCRAFCEAPAHLETCVSFGVEHGFMSKEEGERARRAPRLTPENPGPGGCLNERECHTYCEAPAHAQECISFAEQNGFMSPEEVAQARKFARLAEVEGPGGCRGRSCKDYCESPGHEEECLDFAVREGLIPTEEAAQIKKFLDVSKAGGPGGCRGRACESYCADPGHQEECFAFAVEHDLIPEQERRNAEVGMKLERQLKQGGGPGGCTDENECFVYCREPAHAEECVSFVSSTAGISVEEAQTMLLDFAEKGPGAERFRPRPGELGPPHPGEFGPPGNFNTDDFNKFGPGAQGEFQRRFEAERERRFKEFGGESFGDSPARAGQSFAGPGGCKTPQECFAYCSDPANRAACAGFGASGASDNTGTRGFSMPRSGAGSASTLQSPSSDSVAPVRQTAPTTSGLTVRPPALRLGFDQRSGLYQLSISFSGGIEDFALVKADGSRYGGGVNCAMNYENKIISLGGYEPEQLFVRGCNGQEYAYDLIRTGDMFQTAPPGTLQQQKAEKEAGRAAEEAQRKTEKALRQEVEERTRRATEEATRAMEAFPTNVTPSPIQTPADILRQIAPLEPVTPTPMLLPLQNVPQPQSLFGAVIESFRGLLR